MALSSNILPLLSLVLVLACAAARASEEPEPAAAIERLGLSAGLAVTLGVEEVVDRTVLAAAPGWLLLSLPGDSTAADARRLALAGDDRGRATVHPLLSAEVPVFPRAAGILIVDADALGRLAPKQEAIERALRPYGTAWVKRRGRWREHTAPWPETIADAPHWLGGANLASQVPDQEIGPIRSLRWQSARNEETGSKVIVANGILIGQMQARIGPWKSNSALTAFDAFTGLKLWQRPRLQVFGNYALVMDHERVVLPQFDIVPEEHFKKTTKRWQKLAQEGQFKPVALDVRTGETLLVYDQAPTLPTSKRMGRFSARDMTFNLVDNKLIVVVEGIVCVLDAASGERLWQVEHQGRVLFPAVADGLLLLAQGGGLADTRAHGGFYDAEVTDFQAVIAYDLASGSERWRWQPEEAGEHPRLTLLSHNAGSVWLDYDVGKGGWFLVRLSPKDGSVVWQSKHGELGPTDQFARAFVFDQVVFLSRGADDGYRFDLATGAVLGQGWSTMQGGCLAPRAGASHLYHSAVSVSGHGVEHKLHWAHMVAGRCHQGAFPGHGMLFAADSGCNCDPFIRGLAAYGSDPAPISLPTVTIAGPGRPAAAVVGDAWTTAFRDARRSAWSNSPLGDQLNVAWTTSIGAGSIDGNLAIRRFDILANGIGAPTLAGDLCVVTRPHDHEVVAIEAASGDIRWRHRAMGRLDGAVTLAGGMAVFGSAAGWIEAVSLADGQVVWKTLVAPGGRFRVRSGQVESTHPFIASVAVVGGTVYACGGTHTHVDGGLHFVALDLASGQIRDRQVYDGSPPLMDLAQPSGPHDDIQPAATFAREISKSGKTSLSIAGTYPSQAFSLAYQEQQNGPLVLTPEGWLGLGTLAYDPRGKAIKLGGIDLPFVSTGHNGHLHQNEARWPQQVRLGLLSRIESNSRGHEKAILAGILGRAFAYRDDRIVVIESGTSGSWSTIRSRISAHRWRETPTHDYTNERSGTKDAVSAEVLWADPPRRKPRSMPRALAVCANRALVGEGAALFVYDLESGAQLQAIDLPAAVPVAGIAIAEGRVVVSCLDGSVVGLR